MPTTSGAYSRTIIVTSIALILPALALWLRVAPTWRPWVAGWVGGLSLATVAIYAWDKRRAKAAGGRTPEATLHLLEALGGWPGALVAQQVLRHKNAKRSYQVVFWLIVAAHQYVALDWLLGWQIARAIGRMV